MYDGRLNHDLMQARVVIRRAFRSDQAAITALVHSENLARDDLDWRRFVVALAHGRVIGAVQMRRHADGSQELASLVVAPQFRGRGLAAQLITTLLAQHASPVQMITGARFARRYARFGFQRVPQWRAPRVVLWRYLLGQCLGSARSLLAGRRPRRLAILQRA